MRESWGRAEGGAGGGDIGVFLELSDDMGCFLTGGCTRDDL